jgi:chromosomal replication initiation ATPase DnaA
VDDAQEAGEQLQEWSESPLMAREPKSEEECLWEKALSELRLQMAQATFDQWLKGSRLLEFERPEGGAARLVVGVSSPSAAEWLEHRLKPVIQRTINRLLGQEAELAFQPAN